MRCCVLATFILSAGVVMNAGPRETRAKGLPEQGVDLHSQGSPDHERMANLLGGKSSVRMRDMQPYSAVLHNRNPKTIMTYVVRTEVTLVTGEVRYEDAVYHMDKVRTNEKRLVSNMWSLPDRPLPSGKELPDPYQFLTKFGTVDKVNLVLDLVVYEDGTAIGEDRSGTVNVTTGVRNLFASLVKTGSFVDVERISKMQMLTPDHVPSRVMLIRRSWALQLLKMRQRVGDKQTLEFARERLKTDLEIKRTPGGPK